MPQTYTFSPVTATDRAGLVWVAAILSLMFSVLTLATRLQIKLHTLGLDDWFIAGATLVGLGQYITIYLGLHNGVGLSSTLLEQSHARTLGQYILTSEILTIIALALSKLSVVFFMKRLFTKGHKKAWFACNAALVVSAAWGIAAVLAISVGCPASDMVYGPDRCVGMAPRWASVIAVDALLESLYVALAVALVYPLQMTNYIKVTVVFAFAFRLICAVFSAFRGLWGTRYTHSSDPGLAIANVLVWQQVQLGYALIAATIPTLKGFVRGYNKAMGWDASYQEKRGLGGGYNLGTYGRSGIRSATASKLRSNGGSRVLREQDQAADQNLRPHDGDYHAGAYHDPSRKVRRMKSTGSGNSEDPIIRRDVSVTVETERIGPHV